MLAFTDDRCGSCGTARGGRLGASDAGPAHVGRTRGATAQKDLGISVVPAVVVAPEAPDSAQRRAHGAHRAHAAAAFVPFPLRVWSFPSLRWVRAGALRGASFPSFTRQVLFQTRGGPLGGPLSEGAEGEVPLHCSSLFHSSVLLPRLLPCAPGPRGPPLLTTEDTDPRTAALNFSRHIGPVRQRGWRQCDILQRVPLEGPSSPSP